MKLWGGRFAESTSKLVEDFSTSIHVDQRLWAVDIQGSIAHARMLGKTGILPSKDAETIIGGLQLIAKQLESGELKVDATSEDIHSDIEIKLTEKIGAVAGKLHTARSRNDQIATDLRLYLRGEVDLFIEELSSLQSFLLAQASKHTEVVLPGFTHMQHAQPVSLAHHLLAYFWMFQRDKERAIDLRKRVNILPLGSAALAGTGFSLDRKMVAAELGFAGVTENSLDAVSDRDFVIEFLGCASLTAIHMSRFCEELILWSTPEFGFIRMGDSVTTGSSIMPQKKNPDVAELIRGRAGKVVGALNGALMMLKGLPLSYNRDLQEDKCFLFDGLDTVRSCLRLLHLMLENTKWIPENMQRSLAGDFSNATDLADDLVKKGMPFRQAHEVVGRVVSYCEKNQRQLEDLQLSELQGIDQLFDAQTLKILPHLAVMQARTSEGGTAASAVKIQMQKAEQALKLSL